MNEFKNENKNHRLQENIDEIINEIASEETVGFDSFGLHESIMQALEEANFKVPSSIQQEVIPHILSGRDLVGQAQTGTGKTGAFGLPSLHLLQQNPGSQMLIMKVRFQIHCQKVNLSLKN